LIGKVGDYLLDTNIVIPILNQDTALLSKIAGLTLYIPSIVLGELYFGARRSSHFTANLARIETFRTRCISLSCDENTADLYAQIKQHLFAKGRPIPDNDVWTAAMARQHALTLVSRDEHFNEVDGLTLEKW
jgi:tRNA(fMet)-specific endonuclease VapC